MATVEAEDVGCLAVSKDGRWIAAGTGSGEVFVWDAMTFGKVFWHGNDRNIYSRVGAVDFSPDSTRLVSASMSSTTVWNVATRQPVQTLDHGWYSVGTAKYSPQGDRIATATHDSVRVWDSNDGRLLVDIPVKVTPYDRTGLLWFDNHLFALSDSKIKQIEASTGLIVWEWPVADTNNSSRCCIPKYGEFLACSTRRAVSFWDTATHTQLDLIQFEYPEDICSIAVSPDSRFLAIGGEYGKITINTLSRISVSVVSRRTTNFLAPIIFPCDSTPLPRLPHTPGTRHSDQLRCAPFLEAQSTRKRGRIVDCSNPRVSESKLSCTR
jgi:WD40 repeat protein